MVTVVAKEMADPLSFFVSLAEMGVAEAVAFALVRSGAVCHRHLSSSLMYKRCLASSSTDVKRIAIGVLVICPMFNVIYDQHRPLK